MDNFNQLSVVLYTYEIDGKAMICSCPMILGKYDNKDRNVCYSIPSYVYQKSKSYYVKVDDAGFYPMSSVVDTGGVLPFKVMRHVYDRIDCYIPDMERVAFYYCVRKSIKEKRIGKSKKRKR